MEDQTIGGKNRREQRPQPSSLGAPQSSSSSSLSFNNGINVPVNSLTDATTTRKDDKAERKVKQRKGPRIVAKKLERKKAKKILKKRPLELGEKRGERKYVKQLQMEEAGVMEAAAKEIESQMALMRAIIRIEFLKIICIQLLAVAVVMLQVSEADDNFLHGLF